MYKKVGIVLISLVTLLLINTLSLKAAEPAKVDTRGTISVTGTAFENFSPDTAVIVLSIMTTAKNAQDAAVNNSKKADKVVSQLKQLIKPELGDTIKTSSYTLQPVYEYDNSKGKSILSGYSATNQLTVTTKQIKCVGNLTDYAIASGANQIQSINFEITNNREYCKKLLAKATDNAKEQASVIAQTLGVKISGIKQASGSCGSEHPYTRMYGAKAMFAEAAAPSTPIESGEVKLNATVSVDFYVN